MLVEHLKFVGHICQVRSLLNPSVDASTVIAEMTYDGLPEVGPDGDQHFHLASEKAYIHKNVSWLFKFNRSAESLPLVLLRVYSGAYVGI